jgi:hypothetical protein
VPFEQIYAALEGTGPDDEARRDADTGAVQLAEAPTLASDMRTICEPDIGEPAYVLVCLHRAY